MFVLFDTNFLVLPFQFKFDLFGNLREMLEGRLEFCLVGLSFYELDHIGLAESVKNEILKLISEKNFRTIESNNPKADDAIFEFACKNKRDVIVCTNDMLLRKRLQKQGVRTIGLRGKSRLSFY